MPIIKPILENIRELDEVIKPLKCLGCDCIILTDRCHRFCKACLSRRSRSNSYLPRTARVYDLPREL